jgi:mannose-6-phosphate isomerase-like protein (cupin superfamily)
MSRAGPEAIRQFMISLGGKPRTGPTWNIFGDRMTPILTGKETGGGLVIFENITQPKEGPPRHVHHREDEAFYVVEGKFLFEFGDQRIEGGPTTHVFLPRDIPHCFQNIGDKPGKMIVIGQPAGMEHFFEELSRIVGPPEPAKVAPVFHKWGLELLGPPMAQR